MTGWRIAVLGATGAVGKALLEQLQERTFPISEICLLASENSAGETIRFNGKSLIVQEAVNFDWSQADLAFFVAGEQASQQYAELAAETGCLVIDTSHHFALEADVPLVVPSVNDAVLADYRLRNIVVVANSFVSQLLLSIQPLLENNALSHLQVTHFVSASALGREAVNELAGQSARLLNGLPIEKNIFKKQLAFNLLPHLVENNAPVKDELIFVMQTRKILNDFYLPVSSAYVQSPVFYGNAQIVHLGLATPISPEDAQLAYEQRDMIVANTSDDYTTQIDVLEQAPAVHISCLGQDYGMPEQLRFWSVADNVRLGGAYLAIEVAERLIQDYL